MTEDAVQQPKIGDTPSIGYTEIEGSDEHIRLLCECGQVIKKRRDSFLPGLHVAICLVCGNTSTEVMLLSGSTVAVSAESHR